MYYIAKQRLFEFKHKDWLIDWPFNAENCVWLYFRDGNKDSKTNKYYFRDCLPDDNKDSGSHSSNLEDQKVIIWINKSSENTFFFQCIKEKTWINLCSEQKESQIFCTADTTHFIISCRNAVYSCTGIR